MALIAIDYTYAGGQFFYGIISDLNYDQVNNILASDPLSIEDYFDPAYDFDFNGFLQFADSDQIGYYYYIDEDIDLCEIDVINGGAGGLTSSERDRYENVITEVYMLSDMPISYGLYSGIDFRPVTFLSKVVVPVSNWMMKDLLILAMLSVTFVSLGIRTIGRAARVFGRGR